MNERIKELIEQATSNISVDHEGYRGKGYTEQVEYFDKEKFAVLIVRECTKLLDEDSYLMPELGGYAHDMRKMFGVEE